MPFTPHYRKRKYAAFYRKRGTVRWKRLHPEIAASKQAISRTYQTWLINAPSTEERAIRPIKRKRESC